jgi:hypothetical protein
MSGHPAPVVPCVEVAHDDDRVPKSARDAWRTAVTSEWDAVLTYAMGTTIGSDGAPGGIAESVALRLRRGTQRAVAVWIAPARAICGDCGKNLLPTGEGVFRAHKIGSEPCPGSGQAAHVVVAEAGTRTYKFECAFTSGAAGWWNGTVPQRRGALEFLAHVRGRT